MLCANEDKLKRTLAVDLIKSKKRLFTFGRLDYMTEGLIIISNDGDVYNNVMHPKKKLYKSYIAKIDKEITEEHLDALRYGVVIDGQRTLPAKVKIISKKEIRVAIYEGKNRQIRKMFETLGYTVKNLKRVKVGELTLRGIDIGKYRKMTQDEINYLKSL